MSISELSCCGTDIDSRLKHLKMDHMGGYRAFGAIASHVFHFEALYRLETKRHKNRALGCGHLSLSRLVAGPATGAREPLKAPIPRNGQFSLLKGWFTFFQKMVHVFSKNGFVFSKNGFDFFLRKIRTMGHVPKPWIFP